MSALNLGRANDVMSEHAYVGTQVKRNTLVEFFINEIAADRYISTHLYGAIDKIDHSDVGLEDASDIFATSTSALL